MPNARRWIIPVLLAYVALLCVRLDRVPLLNPDEAAYTEPAWTLLTQGRLGGPMYAGMLRIDERWYFLWPGYAVLAAVPYSLLGVDVLATRVLSAAFGALLLWAVWRLTNELRSAAGDTGWIALGAPGALVLALAHPTLFMLSRLGRPEIGVAACAALSTALAASGERRGVAWRHFAAGAAASLSFLMHQYGGFALAALAAGYLLRRRGWLSATRSASVAAAGALLVLLPWFVWVATDWPDFQAQLGAQLEYQRWRYPDANVWRNAIRDLPGRYVLGRQDYAAGWEPWREALNYAVGPRALASWQGHAESPRILLPAYVVQYWARGGPAPPARLAAAGLLLAAVVAGALALRSRPAASENLALLRWSWLPLLLWIGGLALIPNKWEGYTGAVSAYVCVVVAATAFQTARAARVALALIALLWIAALAYQLSRPPPAYTSYAEQLRALVPASRPVASPMREWFAFAGRNPAVTYEFRSVPAFRTSVLEMVRTQRPEYLVLHVADGATAARGQRYYFINPPWDALYAYLDQSTMSVGLVSDPWFGTVEVRRVLALP
jgi:4-amino-4-deoxy-L-arabinose transferase-like glycosyltransferase